MWVDDYKGFKRFTAELSKSIEALATRFLVFVVLFILVFSVLFFSISDKQKLNNAGVWAVATVLTSIGKGDLTLHYLDESEDEEARIAFQAGQYGSLKALKNALAHSLKIALIAGGFAFVVGGLSTFYFVVYFRRTHKGHKGKKSRLRGAEFLDSEEFKKIIEDEEMGSSYPLGDLSILEDVVRQHLYISGDTGKGKTQLLMDLLSVIRGKNEKAIILDKNGELMSHFYNPKTDYVLGAFDDRSENWTPFLEGIEELDCERMARSFVPSSSTSGKDDHWPESAVTVFTELLYRASRKGESQAGIDEILTTLLESTKMVETNLLGQKRVVVKRGITELVKGSLASLVVDPDAPEHASSVIASIIPKIRSIRYLRGLEKRRDFSIREWVKNDEDKGWLFIRVTEEQLDVVAPLISVWFDTAIKAALSLDKSDERVIWNVIDELQSLGKINTLKKALAEGRKHGLRNLLGFTSVNELFALYGEHTATAMLSQCSTKLVFTTDEPKAAKWNAELLGMEEVVTENESANFGSKDSYGVSEHRSDKFIVMPSEIQRLPKFAAYLKFSGNYPTTKISTAYTQREVVAETNISRVLPPPLVVEQKVIYPVGEGGKGTDFEQEMEAKNRGEKPEKWDENRFRINEPLI
ncbi:MAG: type IV secretion system DNA-binding domain-containing protein [Gammaproteobacteria bacterium]|nr:type IV secretion system DNA-binding domain-containing protein [Gammaproteobacteria bacterium]